MSDDDLSSARHREQVRRDIAQFEIVVERSNARARQVGSVVMLVDGQPIAGIDPAFYFGVLERRREIRSAARRRKQRRGW